MSGIFKGLSICKNNKCEIMYQIVCDKHEFITVTVTTSGGAPEKRFVQCRKCGILQSKKDLTIEEKMDVFFADKEVGEKLVKMFEGLGYEFER